MPLMLWCYADAMAVAVPIPGVRHGFHRCYVPRRHRVVVVRHPGTLEWVLGCLVFVLLILVVVVVLFVIIAVVVLVCVLCECAARGLGGFNGG